MKFPHRLLQIGALALFSSMIGGLVLYRSGFLQALPSKQALLLAEKQDSLPPAWFDSIQFRQILQKIIQERQAFDPAIFSSSKSAPPFPMPPPKTKDKSRSAETSLRTRRDIASPMDTLIALNILRTRYEVAHLSAQEAQAFQQIYANRQKLESFEHYYIRVWRDPVFSSGDSAFALAKLKYGPQHLPQLSDAEKERFEVVLDSLSRPRMMSSKSGIIFISPVDTIEAIMIVKSEKHH